MERSEGSAVAVKSFVRACSDSALKQPVRKFESTFSAEKIVLEKYFSLDDETNGHLI